MRARDLPRLYGTLLEEVDKAAATGESVPPVVKLDPGMATETCVGALVEAGFDRIVAWATAARAHISAELAERGALLRGPLQRPGEPRSGFRGIGPRTSPGAPNGGAQTPAILQKETLPGGGETVERGLAVRCVRGTYGVVLGPRGRKVLF